MKESWEILTTETANLKELLESLLEMVPQSARFHKKTTEINKQWKRLQKAVNEMDKFITPVKSIKVISPLLSYPEFRKTWQLWKEYLSEQHGIIMRSRAELMGLKRLMEITDGNPGLAVKYLEFAISRPTDKNFYKVKDVECTEEPGDLPVKKVIKLPAQYQSTQKIHKKIIHKEIKHSKQ